MKKAIILVLFFLLIFLSFIPRSVEVLNGNFIFLLDQGRDYMAVKNIAVNHKLSLIGAEIGYGVAGFQGIFHGPFYFYLLSIPWILFNGNPYGGLLLMFAFGILTIGISFILAKKMFGIFGGMIMALLVAASPPLISQSRFVWSPHPSSFFILLTFYFIYLISLKKNKHIFLFLAAFFSGFIYNFEIAIVVPMCISLLIYAVFILRCRQLKQYLFLAGGFVAAFSPFLLFEFRHGFNAFKGTVNYLTSFHPRIAELQNDKLIHDLQWFFYNFSDTFPKQNIFPYTIIALIFGSAILFFSIKEKNKDIKYFLSYLLLLIPVTFIVFSFIRTYVFEYYLIHLNFVYILLFSYIFASSYEKNAIRFKTILTAFLITFLFFGTTNAIHVFKEDFSDYGGMVKIKGKIDAVDYIYNDAHGERFGLLVFSPPIYTYPYDYLLWWHGQRKYNYLPHQDKSGLFYLLIEKDVTQPWSYKGWLETVIKEGEILETKELPSGFIIQKRFKQ